MITCPNCNTQNPDDAQSCSNCGAPLSEALYHAPAQPPEGVPSESVEIPEPSPDYAGSVEQALPPPPPPSSPVPPVLAAPATLSVFKSGEKKDRSLALLLEILPGFFGLLGIGWMYSGNIGVGITFLAAFLIWDLIAISIAVLTGFLACFCILPINIVAIIASVLLLNNYIQDHSEAFKA
jgi:hypothetical protein